VEEIWITLYRVAAESAVVSALIDAAHAGKRVTAFVEVKARFDEAANLQWAARMEEAGVRVLYSMAEVKVHAKLALVGTRGDALPRRLAYLATGNFNERTARVYTDHALLTAHPELTAEVADLFGYLAGEVAAPSFRHLLVAPFTLREELEAMVEREVENARAGRPAGIVLKMNSLEDQEMIEALYRASAAGVGVELVVRGICCLAAGVPGQSGAIAARSIVDRFLEHGRVFVFRAGGEERCYLASADWMTRNLSHRVEVAFPLLDPEVRREVLEILALGLADDRKARVLDAALRNDFVPAREGRPALRSQAETYRRLRQACAAPLALSAAPA
jgi:polyphosphate kinase